MKINKSIILCQPDHNKGCSACCGLLNFKDLSKGFLTDFLDNYESREVISIEELQDSTDIIDSKTTRDITSYVCPHQGFLKFNKPGCKIHPLSTFDGSDLRDLSLYGKKICDNFLCPAHKILTLNEKKILIENCDDWYLYTIAIIDPNTTKWLINILLEEYGLFPATDVFKLAFSKSLEAIAKNLNDLKIPIFYYSISEYHLHENDFSAGSMSEKTEYIRNDVMKSLKFIKL